MHLVSMIFLLGLQSQHIYSLTPYSVPTPAVEWWLKDLRTDQSHLQGVVKHGVLVLPSVSESQHEMGFQHMPLYQAPKQC
jgi:hypothetical protein